MHTQSLVLKVTLILILVDSDVGQDDGIEEAKATPQPLHQDETDMSKQPSINDTVGQNEQEGILFMYPNISR